MLLTALSLPPRVRGTATYSDVFPAALSNYSYGGWQGPFGDGTAGRLFPTSDGTGIYADATYNGLVWALRSSPEFSSIDMTMHFSIPNRDSTTADYFALLLILHSPTTPPSTPPGTNCDGTCSYVAGQSGFKILYRIGFNQLIVSNSFENVTVAQATLPTVALNQPHDARATYTSGNLTVYLDGVQLATVLTSSLPAGQVGFETYRTDLIVNTITLIGSPVPGFALSVNPAFAIVASGSSTSATVAVASVSGFSGTVALSVTTSTSSLTASLNPSSLVLAPGGNLTSTLNVNAGSFCGNETVTVTGTSGASSASVTFTARSPSPSCFDYTVAWSPNSATVIPGTGITPNVVALLTSGATTSIACSVSVPVATGLAASPTSFNFTPAAAPGATQAVAITTTTSTPTGSYTFSVSCTLGIGTHTANFLLTVNGSGVFDYIIAWSPTSATVNGGSSVSPNVVATLTSGTTTAVSCTVSVPVATGLAASPLSFSITPATAPGATQAVAITATTSTPMGTYTISVSCSGGGVTRAASPQFSLTVTQPIGYTVAWSPTGTTVVAGTGTTPNVVATLTSGTTTSASCTVTVPVATGLAASPLSFSITPAAAPGAAQAVAITTTTATPSGIYTISVNCTSSIGSPTASFSLTVNGSGPFDYTIAWSPTGATISPGTGTTPTLVTTLTSGTATSVWCTVSVPVATGIVASPASFSITPAFAPGATQPVLISTSTATPFGSYTFGVSCTLGVGSHTANFVLTVQLQPEVTIAWSPTSATVVAGTSTTPNVVATVTSGTTTAIPCTVTVPVATGLAASPLSFSIVPAVAPGATQPVLISTTTATPAGSYSINVSCTTGIGSHTANFVLSIGGAFDYAVAWSPTSATVVAGSGTTPSVVVTLTSGSTTAVSCTVSVPVAPGLAASPLSFSITPAVAPGATQAVTITATTSTPASSYRISVSCTMGTGSHSASFVLTVQGSVQDIDGDGIFNNVDTQPTVFSNDFSDIPLGGTTYGAILSRGDQCPMIPCQLTIQEVSPSIGILITPGAAGGLTPASISVCGGASILSVSPGDQLTVKCGSVTITVITGAVPVTFVGFGSNTGIDGTATITAGNGITFEPATFSFTAPATNTTTITVMINGQALPVAPGQTTSTPFAIFTISVINPTGQVFSAGVVTKFDGSASFTNVGPITSYTWNFGDGTVLTNAASKVTHTYAVNGTYTVTLTVADKLGNSNPQSQSINVLPAPIVGSETFSRNLFVSGNRLIQNVTVQITNPNPYPILVNVRIAGNCDTVCPFSDQSGPILLSAGQTKYISVLHAFSPLDQGQTFGMQVTVTFSTDTSNMTVGSYLIASSRTFSFRIS